MKQFLSLLSLMLIFTTISSGQNELYKQHAKAADSLYNAKDYKKSAMTYSEAFKAIGWKGTSNDRYNAACSWALAGVPDSAFFQLDRIATKSNYTNLAHITNDADLHSLHGDKRWAPLLAIIKDNKEKEEVNLDKTLVAILDTVYIEDQKYRQQIKDIESKFGWESKEMQDHWKIINEKDSINLIKVCKILDTHGWIGPDIVGRQGSSAIFLVIQHADLPIQEKYLPLMREAVKNNKAQGSSLALLEDRVALRQGKRQIYGSQVGRDDESGQHYVLPLEDPDNVDVRRASVGLPPLADYVNNWQIKWNPEQYKKDLPAIEAKQKNKK
ncbi:MAG: DUF6624 domain-containing protein [Saprospiraceae bacterium]|nr:hypothetical protein [Saprospiraceae bacterium]MBP6445681.1 hypothetical protein [Saprospiraceae bacterium]